MFAVRIMIDLPFARLGSLSRPASLDLDPFTKPSEGIFFQFHHCFHRAFMLPGDPGGGKSQQKLGDVVQGQSHHPVDRGADHEALPGHEKI